MVDQIVTDVKTGLAAEKSKVMTWLAQHWPHFVTWLALGWSSLKAIFGHV